MITSPLIQSFNISITFEGINLMNAVECRCRQVVQDYALNVLRLGDGTNFFA